MPKKVIRRIIKKKHEKKKLKKHIKKVNVLSENNNHNQQTNASNVNNIRQLRQLAPLGFSPQQYGNPDLAMQQMRNQNQLTTDQINNYRTTIESMKKEQEKKENELKSIKKQAKEAKRKLESAKIDYDIAKDNYEDNENINKKTQHLMHRTHSLEKINIGQKYDQDINKMTKKEVELDNKIHEKEIQIKRQQGTIAKNKMAGILKEKQDKLDLMTAEYNGMYEYIQSPAFTNPMEELTKLIAKEMNIKDSKKCINELINYRNEIIELGKLIKEHPDDQAAIQTQLKNSTDHLQNIKEHLQKHNDNLQIKDNANKYLNQINERLNKEITDLNVKNNELELRLSYNKPEDLENNIKESIKKKTELEVLNENKNYAEKLMKETREEKRKNDELNVRMQTFRDSSKFDQIQQQNGELAKLQTDYEEKKIEGDKLDQAIKLQHQVDQKELSIAAKENVMNSGISQGQPFNPSDEVSAVYQVNDTLGSQLQQQTIITENQDTCIKILRKIDDIHNAYDSNDSIWSSIYNGSNYPFINGKNINTFGSPNFLQNIYNAYNSAIKNGSTDSFDEGLSKSPNPYYNKEITDSLDTNNSSNSFGSNFTDTNDSFNGEMLSRSPNPNYNKGISDSRDASILNNFVEEEEGP